MARVTKHKSQAVSKPRAPAATQGTSARVDARIQRTRSGIDHAFLQLLLQRPYRSLSVQDICRKAAVGRATFYAHYQSKDELLRSQFTRNIVPLLKPHPHAACLFDCTALFQHVLSMPHLFRHIMSGGEGSGSRAVRAALEERVQAELKNRAAVSGDQDLPQELVLRFVVSTLLAVIVHALQSNSLGTAQQLQSRFARLAGSGLGPLP